jgi:hypothetical protein
MPVTIGDNVAVQALLVSAKVSLTVGVVLVLAACAVASRSRRTLPAEPVSHAATAQGNDSEPADAAIDVALLSSDTAAHNRHRVSGYVACTSPRPRLCDASAQPVCASHRRQLACNNPPCVDAAPAEIESLEYVNGCVACADPATLGYAEGRCNAAQP